MTRAREVQENRKKGKPARLSTGMRKCSGTNQLNNRAKGQKLLGEFPVRPLKTITPSNNRGGGVAGWNGVLFGRGDYTGRGRLGLARQGLERSGNRLLTPKKEKETSLKTLRKRSGTGVATISCSRG